MQKKIEFRWEQIEYFGDDDLSGMLTSRAKVFGGWILRTVSWNRKDKCQSESITFIPDVNHQWVILKPISDAEKPAAKKEELAAGFKTAEAKA